MSKNLGRQSDGVEDPRGGWQVARGISRIVCATSGPVLPPLMNLSPTVTANLPALQAVTPRSKNNNGNDPIPLIGLLTSSLLWIEVGKRDGRSKGRHRAFRPMQRPIESTTTVVKVPDASKVDFEPLRHRFLPLLSLVLVRQCTRQPPMH